MKKPLFVCGFVLASVCGAFFSRAAGHPQSVGPQFTSDGKLVRPEGYRKCVYFSSGYGMSYSHSPDWMQMFKNVYLTPSSYDCFVVHGNWPVKPLPGLERHGATSRRSF